MLKISSFVVKLIIVRLINVVDMYKGLLNW